MEAAGEKTGFSNACCESYDMEKVKLSCNLAIQIKSRYCLNIQSLSSILSLVEVICNSVVKINRLASALTAIEQL